MSATTRVWLWVLGINVAWAAHLVLSYHLAWQDCVTPNGWLLVARHVVSVAALGVTLAAWWRTSRTSAVISAAGAPGQEATAERGYLARVTVLMSVMCSSRSCWRARRALSCRPACNERPSPRLPGDSATLTLPPLHSGKTLCSTSPSIAVTRTRTPSSAGWCGWRPSLGQSRTIHTRDRALLR